MGYNTEFQGQFKITPQLDTKVLCEVAEFCRNRHDNEGPGISGAPWCDWMFAHEPDCSVMYWNGSEKSYSMLEWALYLKDKFFPESKVEGVIQARGEEFSDLWSMVADSKTNTIKRVNGWK